MNILLVDDHPVLTSGLSKILSAQSGIDSVRVAGNCAECSTLLDEQSFDIAILDISLPDGSGIDLARECANKQPECKIVFLTSMMDRETMEHAMALRVSGFLAKTTSAAALAHCLRVVEQGLCVFDRSATDYISSSSEQAESDSRPRRPRLTPRQWKVLERVALGETNKEIARQLDISEKTVRNYLVQVFERLNVQRRAEAAVWFSIHGRPT